MHRELQAVFAEHAAPAHTSKRRVHDALSSIIALASQAQKQVLEYRGLIAAAEVAPHDHALDGKLEMMHQTFGAMEREAAGLSHAARELARCFTQLDRYVDDWQRDIAAYEASAAALDLSNPSDANPVAQ